MSIEQERNTSKKISIFEAFNQCFNGNELMNLCSDYNVEYENLVGETKKAKMESFIKCLDTNVLLDILKDERPHILEKVNSDLQPSRNETNAVSQELSEAQLETLQTILRENFNKNELRELCFSLEIDFENIAGDIKTNKVNGIIKYCQQNNMIASLAQNIISERSFLLQKPVGATLQELRLI